MEANVFRRGSSHMDGDDYSPRKLFDLMEADPSPYVPTDVEIDGMLVDMERMEHEYLMRNHIPAESLYQNAPF